MKHFIVAAALAFVSLLGGTASAQTLIYAHGWLPGGDDLSPYNNTTAWSGYPWGSMPAGAVNIAWNTGKNWKDSISRAQTTLDARCLRSAGQSCTIVCHSTGCPLTAATLDIHGGGAAPRWRINRVLTLGSAEGGSEVATAGVMANTITKIFGYSGVVSSSVSYLSTSYVRGAYDHHDTAGAPFFHVAGYDAGGSPAALILPGQDDGIVAFHSACGYVKVFGSTQCSNDWEWVRKTSWGVPYYVMRDVARWTNHTRVETCGRDGCNKTHMQMVNAEFQNLATAANP